MLLSLLILTGLGFSEGTFAQRKPRVAVLNFSGHQEGKRVTDLAVVKLGESKIYTLLERDEGELARVMHEIGLNKQDELFDRDKKVQLGKVQGVEILILGKVDTYKINKPKLGRVLGGMTGGMPGGKLSTPYRGQWNANVKILFKMINAATTEIMDSSTVDGKASGSDITSAMDDKIDDDFAQELLNKATLDAVGKFVVKLEEKASGLQLPDGPQTPNRDRAVIAGSVQASASTPVPAAATSFPSPRAVVEAASVSANEGRVIDVEGTQISIQLSATTGMRPGDKWKIRRLRKEVKDGEGHVIGKLFDDIGVVEIVEVQPQMLVGKYAGNPAPQKDDYAFKLSESAPSNPAAPPAKAQPIHKKRP
ncbi:MAG TPA: CsgG/HfaB family protein [Blastocatellia bacterium]|nr:CsgG/HfaB family protein [Blastocatellia bacterium]